MALRDIPDEKLFVVLRRLPQAILLIIALLLAGMTFRFWPLELFVSMLPQISIMLAGLFILLFTLYSRFLLRDGLTRFRIILGKRDIITVCFSIFMAALLLFTSLSAAHTISIEKSDGLPLSIATYNKYINSGDVLLSIDYLKQKRVDIVGIQEILPEEAESIQTALGLEYSYSSNCGCSSEDSDVVLLSKYPITSASTVFEHPTSGIIRAEIDFNGRPVVVYAVHVIPPFTPGDFRIRQNALDSLTRSINGETLPVFAMGDFNTTVFSPDYQSFAGANDSKIKNTLLRNWPRCSWHGFSDFACMRIDHLFIPLDSKLQLFEVGNYTGSDHRPVWASVAL